MYAILTYDLVNRAINMVRPAIEAVLGSELVDGRSDFHLTVDWEAGVCEMAWGDSAKWPHPYHRYARSKAGICQRTGMDGRDVRNNAPYLLQIGDTRFVGGVSLKGGIGIGASGLPDHFDEMFARMVGDAIQALCRDAIAKLPADVPDFY